jgi:hypothetical protein
MNKPERWARDATRAAAGERTKSSAGAPGIAMGSAWGITRRIIAHRPGADKGRHGARSGAPQSRSAAT